MTDSLLDRLARELPQFSYTFRNEHELHDGIASVLKLLGIAHEREFVAGPADRFDFFCAGGVVIEAKVKGSWSQAIRQVDRYCLRRDVTAVVVATTKLWGKVAPLPPGAELRGKPVRIVHLAGPAF